MMMNTRHSPIITTTCTPKMWTIGCLVITVVVVLQIISIMEQQQQQSSFFVESFVVVVKQQQQQRQQYRSSTLIRTNDKIRTTNMYLDDDNDHPNHDGSSSTSTSPSEQSSPSSLDWLQTIQKNGNADSNEWGIPDSDTLPPLFFGGNGDSTDVKQKNHSRTLPNGGRVTLVGSGPGDPDLLTVATYRLLTTANPNTDIIIIDRLVSNEIIDLIPSSVPTYIARKLPGCAELAQEEIYWWMYQALYNGKHVIRLKIGDPYVFGRGSEEVLKIRKVANIEATVIPGVSAAFSAPLLGSIPVTHRGVANQVVMCTGYGRDGTSPDLIQYHPEQTIVFLMAVGRLHELCHKLITLAGYPIDTPVAIVEKAGCPDQRTVVGTMTTIAELASKYNVKPPSTIIVGKVVNVLLEQDEITGQHVTGLIQQNMTTTTTNMNAATAVAL